MDCAGVVCFSFWLNIVGCGWTVPFLSDSLYRSASTGRHSVVLGQKLLLNFFVPFCPATVVLSYPPISVYLTWPCTVSYCGCQQQLPMTLERSWQFSYPSCKHLWSVALGSQLVWSLWRSLHRGHLLVAIHPSYNECGMASSCSPRVVLMGPANGVLRPQSDILAVLMQEGLFCLLWWYM